MATKRGRNLNRARTEMQQWKFSSQPVLKACAIPFNFKRISPGCPGLSCVLLPPTAPDKTWCFICFAKTFYLRNKLKTTRLRHTVFSKKTTPSRSAPGRG